MNKDVCTQINDIILKVFNMKYNGQLLSTQNSLNLDLTFVCKEYDIFDVIWKAIVSELEANEFNTIDVSHKYFEDTFTMQLVWAVTKNEVIYCFEILVKWSCANLFVVEFYTEELSQDTFNGWALRGLLEHFCKFNYSKIVNDFEYYSMLNTNTLIPSLCPNIIVDMEKFIKETNGLKRI